MGPRFCTAHQPSLFCSPLTHPVVLPAARYLMQPAWPCSPPFSTIPKLTLTLNVTPKPKVWKVLKKLKSKEKQVP